MNEIPKGEHIRFGHIGTRWTTLRPHTVQLEYWESKSRFIVVPAGRRSGKTEIGKRRVAREALSESQYDDANFGICAPTHKQVKKIYWDDMKKLIPKRFWAKKPSESDLTIYLINGAKVVLIGLDVPERIEGTPWNGMLIDEYANTKPEAWKANIRPALADRDGWAMFIGVPEGRGHYYDLYDAAKKDTSGEWAVYEWSAEDILPAKEIESLRRDLDPITFDQEIRGRFVDFKGSAYYAFSKNAISEDIRWNRKQPLRICFDFNVAPGVALICQEGYTYEDEEGDVGDRRTVNVLDEIYIPRNSNTPMVMERIIERYIEHVGDIYLYGDASGGARGTAKVLGSDWDLIHQACEEAWPGKWYSMVPKRNPMERARLAAVNTLFHRKRCFISPKCKYFLKDLEGVRLSESGDGSIDKDADKTLTHISDAFGYYIAKEYPIEQVFNAIAQA